MAAHRVDYSKKRELDNMAVKKAAAIRDPTNPPIPGNGASLFTNYSTNYKMPFRPAVENQPQLDAKEEPKLISLLDTNTGTSVLPNDPVYNHVMSSASMQDLGVLDPYTFTMSPNKIQTTMETHQPSTAVQEPSASSNGQQNTVLLPVAALDGETGLHMDHLESSSQQEVSQHQASSEAVIISTTTGPDQATNGLLAGGNTSLEKTVEVYLQSVDTNHLVSILARAGRLEDIDRLRGRSSSKPAEHLEDNTNGAGCGGISQPAEHQDNVNRVWAASSSQPRGRGRHITHAESKQWVQLFQGFTTRRQTRLNRMAK